MGESEGGKRKSQRHSSLKKREQRKKLKQERSRHFRRVIAKNTSAGLQQHY